MFWDILVALGIGVTQVALTWYGIYVSVKKNRTRNAFVVAAVGVVGIGLTIVGTVRSSVTQASLQSALRDISKNTQMRASIKIEPKPNGEALPEALSDQRAVRLNFMYLNIGNQEAKNDRLFSQGLLEYGNPGASATIEDVWARFAQHIRDTDSKHLPSGGMVFGVPFFSTSEPPFLTVTADQIRDIVDAKAHIFLAVSIPFEDDRGWHIQEACFWIQQPADPTSPWHDCGRRNLEISQP